MATKDKTREKASTVRTRLEAHDRDMLDWRGEVTIILTRQTEILGALREDFKKYEAQEEKYQEVVSKFMSDTSKDQALIAQKGDQQEKIITKMSENHESAMKLIRDVNKKVWIATGAIIVYAPVIAYIGMKLFEHLTQVKMIP